MSQLFVGRFGRQLVVMSCVVCTLLALACVWPVPGILAEEPAAPPKAPEEQPAEKDPPAQKTPAEGDAETPAAPEQAEGEMEAEDAPATAPGALQRFIKGLLFGPTAHDNSNKRKKTDPRAPFNQKLSTLFKKAQTQFKAGETRQSLDTLQRLLEMPEDSLYEAAPGKLISVRSAAHRLLAQLPAADLDRYRQQYGGLAKRELQQAIAIGTPAALAQVATKYFQTESGFQAGNLLATRYLDRGEYGLAAFWLRELLESRAPLTQDSAWRMKAEYVANKIDSKVLKTLLAKQTARPGEKIVLAGQPVDRAAWLATMTKRVASQTPTLQDWPQFFGSARRVGQAAAGEPLLLPRWSYPMSFSPAIHERISQLVSDLRDEDQVPIFAFDPLLVDGKIIFRSLRGVKVVNADTGHLLWETADEPAVEDVLALTGSGASDEQLEGAVPNAAFAQIRVALLQEEMEDVPVSDNPLTHLLFRNANHGLLSSDSKRLFVIEDLSVMTNLQPGQYWGEDLPEADTLGRTLGINRLTAYDLQTGRSVWEVGGPALNDPFELPLAGSFFFGAPVVDGRDLFVVAEKDGQIRLQALDAVTGQPRWSQLIAHSQAKISMDVGRQWLCAPVAVGEGVIVCPTTVGWIVAIDRSTHGILWAYRYQDLNSDSDSEPQDEAVQPADLNERWAVAPPVIVGDRVIFTPPEDSNILCLSLSDGQKIWSVERDSSLYLAGVFGEQALVVNEDSITSINIRSPKQVRTVEFKSDDSRPAGRGVAVQDRYYLPLTTGELLAINLKTFQLESTTFLSPASKPELKQFGNLAMYRGMLMSLSPHGLVAFEPKLSIETELQQQLTQDPQSAPAAVRKAELELLQHHYLLAREVLHQVRPGNLTGELRQRYRAAVVTTLSALVREDLAAKDAEFEELSKLAEQPTEVQAREILRAERLVHRQDFLGAFAVYSQFAQSYRTDMVTPKETTAWQVRGDHWAAGQIEELWKTAPANVKEQLDQSTHKAATEVLAQDRTHQEQFLTLYGFHPAATEVRQKLAAILVEAREWQAAENLLLDLQADPAQAVRATERLAHLWLTAGLPADAAHFYHILERDHGSATWDGTKTVAQFIQEQRAAGTLPTGVTQPVCDWRNRLLQTTRAGSNYDGGGMTKEFNQMGAGLPYFRQYGLQFVMNEPRFEVIDAGTGSKLWSLPVRDQSESGGGAIQMNVSGHQVVLFQGGAVTALSPTERRVLWSRVVQDDSAEEEDEGNSPHFRLPTPMHVLSNSRTGLFGLDSGLGEDWSRLTLEGKTRFADQRHVCYLSRRQLEVLDARTGETLWKRSGLPSGTHLLAGTRVIYAWHPGEDSVTAYQAVDGRELTIPKLASLCKKSICAVGDDFISLAKTTNTSGLMLQRFDPLSQTARWTLELPRKTLATALSGDRLGLLAPDGQLQICDLRTGVLRPCGMLDKSANRADRQIYMVPTYDQLLVIVHQDSKFPNDRYGETFPSIRVAGTIQSFDLATGKEQWKQSVAGLHLILEHLDHSPIVLLVARTFEQNGSSWKLSLMAIDRQHGQIVHQSDSPVQSSYHQMSVNMKDEYVELRTYNERLRLMPK